MKYFQCLLVKNDNNITIKTVAWIPEKYAKKNKLIRLLSPEDEWSDGWKVVQVYPNSHDEEYIKEHEREFIYWKQVLND
jgi:hypothetical protein